MVPPSSTILTRYSSNASSTTLLTNLGIDGNERDQFATDGFENMSLLVKHFSYEIGSFKSHLRNLNKTFANAPNARRMYFNPICTNRLLGVLYYFTQAINTFHTVPDISSIDQDMADELGSQYLASLRKYDVTEEQGIVKLPSLTGSTNWRAFKDKLLLKLSTMKSTRGINLEYIADTTIRQNTRGSSSKILVDKIDVSDEEYIRSNATHFGSYFKEDDANTAVMLKKALLNTSAYNHITVAITKKSGRQAIILLRSYYEGEDFIERNIEQAFASLNNTFYKGEHKNFNFEKFVAIHLEAHRLLNEAEYNNGAGMDNATKIQHLKSGIKLDAGLEHAMTTARTNKLAQGDFQGYVSFMSAEIDMKTQRLKQLGSSRSRMIAGIQGGFRGGGRGGGRGGRGGRGRTSQSNTSNPNTSNLGPVLKATVDGKTVESKRYSYQEFNQFNQNQRNKIMDLHKQRKRNATQKSDTRSDSISNKSVDQITESISDAIVAGMKQATFINDDEVSEMDDSQTAKRKAESGSVGTFIKNRRKNTSNSSSH